MDDFCEINSESKTLGDRRRSIFHTITAKVLYVSRRLRLDLLFAVSFLSTRVINPTEEDWAKLCRVIGYMKRTANMARIIPRQDETIVRLEQYVDASFGLHHDGKSHTGSCIFWGNACISANSSKQKMVSRDSTDAELIGLSDKVADVEWATEFIRALGVELRSPIIYQDNQSCLELVYNDGNKKYRSKHLRVRRADMHEKYVKKEVLFCYCPTNMMVADSNSKTVAADKFYWCTTKMLPSQNLLS